MAKGASSQKVDELAIAIGLDLDQLRLDFDAAGMTVRQAMSRLNSESTQLKLKADTASFKAAGDAIEQEKIKMQALTQQIEIQSQKLRLLGAARDSSMKSNGADSGITRGAETAYLRQERYVAQLNAELKKMQGEASKAGASASSAFDKIQAGAAKAKNSVSGLTGIYGTLSSKLGALMGIAVTGAGLFNITDKAMQSGEALYQLANRLHLTTGEAASLNRLFSISGVSIQGVIPYFSQLDKTILSSDKGLSSTSLALMQFGVNLKDSSGNLLPLNQQLDQLAQGYQRAAEAGKLEEFQAAVLGRRGTELIPLLENYNDNLKIAQSIKTTGLLDPNEAHELSLEWRQMKAEAGQLGSAFGAAMMPIAKELMPEVTDGMKDFVSEIRDNKDDIKSAIEGWATALGALGKVAGEAAVAVGKTAKSVKDSELGKKIDANNKAHDYDEAVLEANGLGPNLNTGTAIGAIGGAVLGRVGGVKGSAFGAYVGGRLGRGVDVTLNRGWANLLGNWDTYVQNYNAQKQEKEEAAEAEAKEREEQEKNTKATQENSKAAEDNATSQQKAAEAMKQRETAAGRLSEKIYALTHNDVENATHAMYVEAEKARANGVSDDLIGQFIGAQSARIAEDKFRNVTAPMAQAFKTDLQNQLDSIDLQAKSYIKAGASESDAQAWAAQRKAQINADWDREVAAQIDSIWKTSFQNRLDEIEREKQAWIKKGLDEVKATQWAEEKKKQTVQEAAQSMFTSEKKYYDVWKKAGGMASGQAGIDAIAKQMRKDKGIPDGAFTTPGEISAFENAMKAAQSELVPIISDGTYQGVKAAMVEVMHGTSISQVLPQEQQEQLFGGGRINTMRGGNAAYDNYDTGFDSAAYHAWTEADALKLAQLGGLMNDAQWGSVPQQQQQAAQQAAPINVNITANLQGSITPDNAVDELSERVARKVDESMQEARRQIQSNQYNTY